MTGPYPRLSIFKSAAALLNHLETLGVSIPCDDEIQKAPDSPLAQPLEWGGPEIGNRWAIHPMEGWDGTREGRPSEHTVRRWRRFGESGAKLIWGGEAVAVRHDGRANPNQLLINEQNLPEIEKLRIALERAHTEKTGDDKGLYLGLQLTHSGRFSRPNDKFRPEPRILYRHPILDCRVGVESDERLLTDSEIDRLIEDFVSAASLAAKAGFHFVDIKHCHGYLGHEFLSSRSRQGKYGGDLEGRTLFLRAIVDGVRSAIPGLEIGVRVSAFDVIPHRPNPETSTSRRLGEGLPEPFENSYPYAFGGDPPGESDQPLEEAVRFVRSLLDMNIRLVNVTAGSPYYVPHIQRPAYFPPSDGYQPPEDPLIGVARLLNASRILKAACPEAIVVGTGFSYLQEFAPLAAQAMVREGWMDFAGLGRMVLTYPEMPYDTLWEGNLDRKRICRTFSDCTTGPRKGLISGCFPLDAYYKDSDVGKKLRKLKAESPL